MIIPFQISLPFDCLLATCHSSVHVSRTSSRSSRPSVAFAVSNEVPEQPVLSPVSGCIYEKRLIVKYLHESPTDPVTGQPLTEEQLIDVKGGNLSKQSWTRNRFVLCLDLVTPLGKPKPPSATSIPAILKMLQDEWDSTMLHSFTLRQQLQTARQGQSSLHIQVVSIDLMCL